MVFETLYCHLAHLLINAFHFIPDLADLEAKENRLDEMIRQCTSQLRVLTEDPENSRLAYVNYHDIRSIKSLEEQTVIAIKAPPETRLEVPDPNQVRN